MKTYFDMMDNYDAPCGEEEMTQEERERILQITLRKTGLTQGKEIQMKKKKWVAAVAAAAIAVTVLGAAAVNYLHLDDAVLDYFKAERGVQVQTIEEAAYPIERTVEDGGWKLDMRGCFGDKFTTYVLMDLYAPDGVQLEDKDYSFSDVKLMPKGQFDSFSSGYSVDRLASEDGDSRKLTFLLSLNSSIPPEGIDMKFDFSGLRYYEVSAGDYIPVTDAAWSLDNVTLGYRNLSKEYKLDQEIEVFGCKSRLKAIYVSPFSVSVVAQGGSVSNAEHSLPSHPEALPEGAYETLLEDMENNQSINYYAEYDLTVTVTLKDGSMLEVQSGGSAIEGDTMTRTCHFDRLIQPDQVASVTVCGVTVPMQ